MGAGRSEIDTPVSFCGERSMFLAEIIAQADIDRFRKLNGFSILLQRSRVTPVRIFSRSNVRTGARDARDAQKPIFIYKDNIFSIPAQKFKVTPVRISIGSNVGTGVRDALDVQNWYAFTNWGVQHPGTRSESYASRVSGPSNVVAGG